MYCRQKMIHRHIIKEMSAVSSVPVILPNPCIYSILQLQNIRVLIYIYRLK
jgi:hypothetical protein